MADKTYSVKVSPEIRDKIDQMIAASETRSSKEWFEGLLALYELQQLKSQMEFQKFTTDLEMLEGHSTRIQEIIIATVKKANDTATQLKYELAQVIDEKENEIADLKTHVCELKSQLMQKESELIAAIHEDSEQETEISRLLELNESRKCTIDNQFKEITRLNETVHELELRTDVQVQDLLRNENHMLTQQYKELIHKVELLELKHQSELKEIELQFRREQIKEFEALPKNKRGRPKGSNKIQNVENVDEANSEGIGQS